jgi:hypothetical protein
MRHRLAVLAIALGLFAATTAQAGHHLWVFSEIFSNASGTIQYVEMSCPANSEAGLGPFTVVGASTFNFVTNLPNTSTANTHILIATSGFGSLAGGVTPDYIIPGNFLATGGGTLNYATGIQIWNYGTVPTDGIHALHRDGSTGVNAPTNFLGNSGSVNLASAVPAAGGWGMALLIGAILLFASGLLRKRQSTVA